MNRTEQEDHAPLTRISPMVSVNTVDSLSLILTAKIISAKGLVPTEQKKHINK